MYVVTCVTGRTGAIVAQHLLEAGRKIRVVVRKEEAGHTWRHRGAEVIVADYANIAAMTHALRGADAAYVIPPPLPVTTTGHHTYRVARTQALAEAIDGARVPHVVSLSSFAAHADGTRMITACNRCEAILNEIPSTLVTHLRPAFFLDNWAAQIPAMRHGILPSFLGPVERKFAMVGTPDVAAVATRLLLEPSSARRVVELAGHDDYSVIDIARAFARLLGRQIEPIVHPVTEAAAALLKNGFSEEMAASYQELFAGMMSGRFAFEGKAPLERGTRGLLYSLGVILSR
jgi:uncharacterized protein YbjT (DUF2867 family)